MARQLYNRGNAAWTTNVGAATALERLRDLRMVDRNTGIALTDAQVNTPGTVNGVNFNDDVIEVNGLVTFASPTYLVNKHIVINVDAGGRMVVNDTYVQMFNCTIEANRTAAGAPHEAVNTPMSDGIDANNGGHVDGEGFHMYGCSWTANNIGRLFVQATDVVNTNVSFGPGVAFSSFAIMTGARIINTSIYSQTTGAAITYYNAPLNFEGVNLGGTVFEINVNASGQNLVLAPNQNAEGSNRFGFSQTTAGINTILQQVGFFSWPSNTESEIFDQSSQSANAYYSCNTVNQGGTIGYYPWRPEFAEGLPVYDANGLLTNGIQSVNVRVGSNATLTSTAPGASSATNASDRISSNTGDLDQSSNNINLETEYISTTNGVIEVDANTRYTSAGWSTQPLDITGTAAIGATTATFTTSGITNNELVDFVFTRGTTEHRVTSNTTTSMVFTPALTSTLSGQIALTHKVGWVDWLKLGIENDITAADNPGGSILGSNFKNQNSPANVAYTPLQVYQNGNAVQYSGRLQARSYTHDIDFINNQNGVIGTAAGNQAASTLVEQQDVSIPATSLIGSRIKESNRNADNTPNFDSFTADSPVSLNDIANAVRAGWSRYYVDVDSTKQTGNFDETTYPIRLHIRQASETGGNLWQDEKFGMKVAGFGGGGQFRVAVLGNGLANADDDLFPSLAGVRSLNFDGLPLSNVTLTAQERLVNMGNVTNAILTAGDDTGGDPETSSLRYDLFFNDSDVEIRGTTVLTSGVNRPLTEADINLPTVVGTTYVDADSGETIQPNITIARGTLIQSIGTEGLLDNSVWNNVSTMTDVVADNVRNWTINGGTHQMTVTNVPVGNLIWNITNQIADGLNIVLPNTSPTGLVRINTDNQAGEIDNYNEVNRWLSGITGLSYHNQRLDETAPTSGYWLVAPPLAPAEPRTFTVAPPIANITNTTLQNVIAAGGSFVYETGGTVTSHHISNATTLDDITITTNNEADDDYNIWYKPLSYVDGNDSIIYDYNHTTWNPTTDASGSIGIFQPDPNGAVTGTATFDSTTTGVVTFNTPVRTGTALSVTLTSGSDDSGAVQSLGWAIANSSQYMEYVAANTYTNASTRPLQFDKSGTGATTTFATNITLRSTTGQRFLNGASGFVTQQAGTAPNTFPEVRGSATNVIFGSDAQISALAGGDAITELGNELKANQGKLSTDVRLSSQFRVASGTIPNTAD